MGEISHEPRRVWHRDGCSDLLSVVPQVWHRLPNISARCSISLCHLLLYNQQYLTNKQWILLSIQLKTEPNSVILKMKAAHFSETSEKTHYIAWCRNSESRNLSNRELIICSSNQWIRLPQVSLKQPPGKEVLSVAQVRVEQQELATTCVSN